MHPVPQYSQTTNRLLPLPDTHYMDNDKSRMRYSMTATEKSLPRIREMSRASSRHFEAKKIESSSLEPLPPFDDLLESTICVHSKNTDTILDCNRSNDSSLMTLARTADSCPRVPEIPKKLNIDSYQKIGSEPVSSQPVNPNYAECYQNLMSVVQFPHLFSVYVNNLLDTMINCVISDFNSENYITSLQKCREIFELEKQGITLSVPQKNKIKEIYNKIWLVPFYENNSPNS